MTGVVPMQVPPWQESASVERLPSLHDVPSPTFGFVHTPVAGLQVPARWH